MEVQENDYDIESAFEKRKDSLKVEKWFFKGFLYDFILNLFFAQHQIRVKLFKIIE